MKGVIIGVIFLLMEEEVERMLRDYSIVKPLSAESLAGFMGERELIFIDASQPWAKFFISSAITVDAPVERVWKAVTDFGAYSQFMPLVTRSAERKVSESLIDTSFTLTIKIAVIPFSINFSLLHHLYPYEDITWTLSRKDEDLAVDYGKWEFYPLEGNRRTLAIYSVFTQARSKLLTSILEKEPILELGFDIALSSAVPKVIKERVEGRRWTGLSGENTVNIEGIKTFLERGSVILLSPSSPLNIYSAYIVTDGSPKDLWDVVTDYPHYHEFVPMIKRLTVKKKNENCALVTYDINFNFLIFKKRVKYVLEHTFHPYWEIKWDFVDGEIKGVKGDWKLYELREGKTLGIYTYTSDLKSTGFIFKLLLNSFPILDDSIQASIGAAFTDAVKKEVVRRKRGVPFH